MNISIGMIRMLKFLVFQLIMVHLMACIWFMFASFEDNIFNTWVGAKDLVDADPYYIYFNAFYWAL